MACALLMVSACTHHRSFGELSRVRGAVVVESVDHRTFDATAVNTRMGVVFHSSGRVVDVAQLRSITDTNREIGGLESLAIGVGVGFASGAIFGYASGDDDPCDALCFLPTTAGGKARLYGAAIGGFGGLLGLLIGITVGASFVYEGTEVAPGGPAGSVAGVTAAF